MPTSHHAATHAYMLYIQQFIPPTHPHDVMSSRGCCHTRAPPTQHAFEPRDSPHGVGCGDPCCNLALVGSAAVGCSMHVPALREPPGEQWIEGVAAAAQCVHWSCLEHMRFGQMSQQQQQQQNCSVAVLQTWRRGLSGCEPDSVFGVLLHSPSVNDCPGPARARGPSTGELAVGGALVRG